ncbi:MAG: hypothetical protein IJT38_05545 [Clostridia bacterium]|nr:hypothetical protein [Clostridia bacterium]
MSIILQQTSRTQNSVTFSISGITNDRMTYVWMPMMSSNGQWVSLSSAYSLGYVKSFSTTSNTNGSITVEFYQSDANEYKVWQFYVANYSGGSATETSEMLNTILKFEYENTSTKHSGSSVDVTVDDLRQLNLFGVYIFDWIIYSEGGASYYPLKNASSGDPILAKYLVLPAQNIYNAANKLTSSYYNSLSNRTTIKNYLSDIINNASSGSAFYADYFNNIKSAINNFNCKTT